MVPNGVTHCQLNDKPVCDFSIFHSTVKRLTMGSEFSLPYTGGDDYQLKKKQHNNEIYDIFTNIIIYVEQFSSILTTISDS